MAERHDTIVKLKNEINDMEQQLKQKDTHIQFKDEIIKELRQQRRGYLKVCHQFLYYVEMLCFQICVPDCRHFFNYFRYFDFYYFYIDF